MSNTTLIDLNPETYNKKHLRKKVETRIKNLKTFNPSNPLCFGAVGVVLVIQLIIHRNGDCFPAGRQKALLSEVTKFCLTLYICFYWPPCCLCHPQHQEADGTFFHLAPEQETFDSLTAANRQPGAAVEEHDRNRQALRYHSDFRLVGHQDCIALSHPTQNQAFLKN